MQLSKLLNIPFVAVVEFFWYSRRFAPRVILSMVCVVAGVGMLYVGVLNRSHHTTAPRTVTGQVGVNNLLGLAMAALSVVSSSLQQLLCRHLQKKHSLSSQELLAAAVPLQVLRSHSCAPLSTMHFPQGAMLVAVGPVVDRLVTKRWVFEYEWSPPAVAWLTASCLVAVALNLSQFLVLGRFTALTVQVVGHLKTLIVLVGGLFLFNEAASGHQLGAMALALGGVVWYGIESSRPASVVDQPTISEEETQLLPPPPNKSATNVV